MGMEARRDRKVWMVVEMMVMMETTMMHLMHHDDVDLV